MATTIYALCDPYTEEIRYIGKTVVALSTRLSQHVTASNKGKRIHLHCWMRSLGVRPVIKPLAIVSDEMAGEMEIKVIAAYRDGGFRLTNTTDGGEGNLGLVHSEESKAKIRAWGIGRKMPPISPETRERMAEAQRGKQHSPEHKAKIAAAGIGRIPTEETRAKLRASKQGFRHTPESREKLRIAHLGKKLSDEHKAKIRTACQTPEARRRAGAANAGRIKTREEIAKHAAALRGRRHSPEAVERMREAAVESWARRREAKG